MLRSDYKYSRKPPADSAAARDNGIGYSDKPSGASLLSAPSASDDSSVGGSSKRGGSMKHWSPLTSLGKKARDGLRRCNTVRVGLGASSASSMASSSSTVSTLDSGLGSRRNAMPNIFLGLPSSGVRRLFAIYGIDDTRGGRVGSSVSSTVTFSASTSSAAAAAPPVKCEESLFARHSRTSSVRSRRPPSVAGPMQQQQYQHMLMVQQHQQHLLLPPGYAQQLPQRQLSGGQVLDRRRASSMRDHQGKQHRTASSRYGNW